MASRRQGNRMNAFGAQGKPEKLAPHEAAHLIYGTVRTVTLDEITIDPSIQIRVDGLDMERVSRYADFLLEGGAFRDPIILFQDGEKLLLAAGFHRCEAVRIALEKASKLPESERVEIAPLRAEIRTGGRTAAAECAEEDNLAHGLELSTRDKRNILQRRLERGHEWAGWSNRRLAAALGVDEGTVRNWRRKLTAENSAVDTTRIGADGRVYDVSNIQAANQERVKEQPPRTPSPRRVDQHDGYDFNQDSGYEEGALDYGEPETWRDVRQHQPDMVSADGESAARRVNVALVALLNAVLETAAAIETMDAGQDHFTAGELRDIETSATEVLQYLQGYRSRQGRRVAGLLDLLDGLRRFVRGGLE